MVFAGIWAARGGAPMPLPSAVFSSRERAEAWISEHRLTGMLTMYRLDVAAYDWAVRHGRFTPTKPEHRTAAFVGAFSGGDRHFHYEDGKGRSFSVVLRSSDR